MTYKYCKNLISNGSYKTKEEMLDKLDVFLLNDRITEEQYNELVTLLNAVAGDETTTEE